MPSLRDRIQNLFTPVQPLPAGVYHYQAPPEDPRNYRLHLRLEEDGSGVLILNAATVLHLNRSAAEYAYYLVKGLSADEVVPLITDRYKVRPEEVRLDYLAFQDQIDALINTPDLDPVSFLGFERELPFTGATAAPYRLDCALTYRLAEGTDAAAAPTERVSRELSTEEWFTILDKAWEAGIPHIVFTGGEPTLRPDLAELISHAEHNGQVTGLLSDGLRLADQAYLDSLLLTGLDHLEILLQPDNPTSWQALETTLVADLFVAVHLTLTGENQDELETLLPRLAEMGVRAISLSERSPELSEGLEALRNQVAALNLELVWNLPVPYSALNPVSLETAVVEEPDAADRGTGKAWMYVEPDGDVLPAQGITHKLGNLLTDPWEKIWRA